MTQVVRRVVLEPITEAEFAAYLPVAIEEYGEDLVTSGRISDPVLARQIGEQEIASVAPEGLATKNSFVYTARDAESGEPVGFLWLGLRGENAQDAFVYDIRVDESRRGLGYGRATMIACIARAAELGASTVGLHVFGHAAVPRALYSSLGFVETSVQMSLPLKAGGPFPHA
jgi:GNAT superfamily N-acetyltransferase